MICVVKDCNQRATETGFYPRLCSSCESAELKALGKEIGV